jgi:Acetyltransferase (GNAT) domain
MAINDLDVLDMDAAERLDVDWPDVYFTPAYGRAVAALHGWTWRLATAGPILFPFLMRPIDPMITGGQQFYDAVSPYGYSGTAALGPTTARDWTAFRSAWRDAARDMNIVGEFHRFSPFVDGRAGLCAADGSIHARKHNLIVLVHCEDADNYWESVSGMVRNRVRRASKLGYKAVVSTASQSDVAPASPFRELYEQTMKAVNASDEYVFSDSYYVRLTEHLGDALQICSVVNETGHTVAAGLFFVWNGRAHFHLAGSDRSVRKDGCNILRLDAQIRWASEAGCRFVNLGGGRDEDDPLFRFKANFGSVHLPFHVGTAILDDEIGDRLMERGYSP